MTVSIKTKAKLWGCSRVEFLHPNLIRNLKISFCIAIINLNEIKNYSPTTGKIIKGFLPYLSDQGPRNIQSIVGMTFSNNEVAIIT